MSMGYDAPPSTLSYSHFDSRRNSGSISSSYDRPGNSSSRQRSPSPGPSRRAYDSYVPHRSDNMPYRNSYRPNIYRPDHSSYYPRSPSPDSRSGEPSSYRGSSWRPRLLPPSPTSRRFEPSDSWRHSHVDRSGREYVPPSDRHLERHGRSSVDVSPERSPRFDRSSYVSVPDRHPPLQLKRETWPERRPFMDSYRPNYDTDRPPPPRRDFPHSPVNGHSGRDFEPFVYNRPSEYPEYPRPSVRKPSAPASASGVYSPIDPPWSSPTLAAAKRDPPPRQPSRSSIASTHASDRVSPGAASIPQPSIRLPASLPAKPQAAIDALANEKRRDIVKSGMKNVQADLLSPVPTNAVEAEQVAKPVSISSPPEEEDKNDLSEGLTVDSRAVDQKSSLEDPSLVNNLPTEPAAIEKKSTSPSPSPSPSLSPKSPLALSPMQAKIEILPIEEGITTNGVCVVELKQPKPISPLECTPSVIEVLDGEIPPPIHWPSPPLDPAKEPNSETSDSFLVYTTLPKPEDIPPLSSAKTKDEALRIAVMTRMLRDHQSREARVNPVLLANRTIAPPAEVHPSSTPTTLLDKMLNGLAGESRLEAARNTRPMLVKHFAQRQAMVDDKMNRLREEYAMLHERWAAHCAVLNEQQRTLASEQENQPPMRTTRRSIAFTDAVRSDFEMEQIIASLGNDEATDPVHLSMRNLAKVPDMISVVNGKLDAVFDDRNDLVENPAEYYAPYTGTHDWTETEKKIFMEKFGAFPKQFGTIADFLPNKTAAQCVEYYYLHKKMFIDFRRVISQYAPNKRKRRGMGRKKGNGLLADIAMHDLEVNRGSSPSTSTPTLRTSRGRRTLNATAITKPPSRRNAVQFEETPTSTPTPEPETKTRKRKAASGTSTPNASNAPTSVPASSSTPSLMTAQAILVPQSVTPPAIARSGSLTTSLAVEDEEVSELGPRPVKRPKRTRKIKSAVMVLEEPASPPPTNMLLPANEVIESASASRSVRKEKVPDPIVDWSEQDKTTFLSLHSQYGPDFKQIASCMPYKTISQITSYYTSNKTALNLGEETNAQWTVTPDSERLWTAQPVSASPHPSVGYDKNSYPSVSSLPYSRHGGSSEEIRPSWTTTPLPTRLAQRTNFPASSTRATTSVSGHTETSHLPIETHHQAAYSPPVVGSKVNPQYSYPPPMSEFPPGYSSSATSVRYPENPDSRPSRHSYPSSVGPLSPNSSTSSPQSHRQYSRPRISTSSSSSLLSHVPGGLGYGPGPSSGATAIVHSPTIPSPKLPMHHSPPPYGQHRIPPRSDPRSGGDARAQGHRYLPSAPTHSPVNHHHPKQRSASSSSSGWDLGSTSSPQQRHYGPEATSGLYDGSRGASGSSGSHGKSNVHMDRGRHDSFPLFSSIILPSPNADHRQSSRPGHSLSVLNLGDNGSNQVHWQR